MPLFEPFFAAKKFAMEYLKKGRVGWDIPHTTAVFYYSQIIAHGEKLDPLVFGTTAWLHDIGYCEIVKPSPDKYYPSDVSIKTLHMQIGQDLANQFMDQVAEKRWFTPPQRSRVAHLVGIHDNHKMHTTIDEIAFAEADTLGTISVRPTFVCKEDADDFIKNLLNVRAPRFKTRTGLSLLQNQIPQFMRMVREQKLQRLYSRD